jgi:hypothetical protein
MFPLYWNRLTSTLCSAGEVAKMFDPNVENVTDIILLALDIH